MLETPTGAAETTKPESPNCSCCCLTASQPGPPASWRLCHSGSHHLQMTDPHKHFTQSVHGILAHLGTAKQQRAQGVMTQEKVLKTHRAHWLYTVSASLDEETCEERSCYRRIGNGPARSARGCLLGCVLSFTAHLARQAVRESKIPAATSVSAFPCLGGAAMDSRTSTCSSTLAVHSGLEAISQLPQVGSMI